MKKNIGNRILSLVLALVMVLACMPGTALPVFAADTNGSCGEELTWKYDEDTKTLTISGTGDMTDYSNDNYAPWHRYEIYNVNIDSGVTGIGDYAFYEMEFARVTVPDTVTRIGKAAFRSMESLETVTLPAGLTAIEDDTFGYCPNLSSITIPDTVTYIGEYAFSGCHALETISIPSGVKTIGHGAFFDCGFKSIALSEGLEVISDAAFYACDEVESIVIPGTVTTIGDEAFANCDKLKYVTFPASVTSIGNEAFRFTSNLTEITVDPNNAYYCSEDGVLFNKDKTVLICYPEQKADTSYTIPSTVTTIAGHAFDHTVNLENLTIPSGVTTIGTYCFYKSVKLSDLTIPASVTLFNGYFQFAGCTALKSVKIETGAALAKGIFQDCTALETVVLSKELTEIRRQAFHNCTSLQAIHYPGTKADWTNNVTIDYTYNETIDAAMQFCTDTDADKDHICDTCGNRYSCIDDDNNAICDICGEHMVPVFQIADNKLFVSYDGGCNWEEIGNVADGKSVESIDKTATNGNVDTYTITYSDGSTSTFTVTNGKDGADGITPQFKVENSILYVSYDEGQTWTSLGSLKGDKGDQGEQGEQGDKGETGNGIAKIEKTSTNGLVDTYTITYTDGTTTTFTVTNGEQGIQGIQGEKGDKGDAPVITIQNGNWYIDGVDTGVAATGIKGDTGNGISDISLTNTEGLVDTYTITYTDGTTTTFTVTNGEKGDKGEQGEQGIQGIQGEPGKDGHTPIITIQNGNWYIDGVDTGAAATGIKGDTGNGIASIVKTSSEGLVDTYTITYTDGTTTTFTVTNGEKGEQGEQGIQGIQGVPGKDGHTPVITIVDGYWYIDGVNTGVAATGIKGDKGDTGNGIAKIEKTSSDGLVDTYTITYTDGTTTTFTVTNGAQGVQGTQGVPGKDGHTPVITIQNGNWFVDGVDTGVAATGIKGDTGNGIASIKKTGIDGLVDTYTITYTDGTTTTFTVTNGEKGEQGEQGIQGVPGKDGHTPVITIVDGYWYIDGVNTNILAVGAKGEDGKDGVTPQLRINSENIWEVSYDNGATWESLGISAVGQNGSNGTNGVTPKLRVNSKNVWEVSYDNGATWESLGISAVGTNGTNGANGKDGADGKDGKDGKDGVDGKDGITPKLRINDDNIWEVSYDNGQTWESLGVSATGADGVTPQLRINGDTNMWEVSYDNGATWTSMGVVATGANGKDGGSILPIIISCISLAGMVIMFCIMMADRKKSAYAGRH